VFGKCLRNDVLREKNITWEKSVIEYKISSGVVKMWLLLVFVLIIVFVCWNAKGFSVEGFYHCPPYHQHCDVVGDGGSHVGKIDMKLSKSPSTCHPIHRNRACESAAVAFDQLPKEENPFSTHQFDIRCENAGSHPCFTCFCNKYGKCIHQVGSGSCG